MAKSSRSTRAGKAAFLKPREDYPLTPHRNGQWCKRVKGALYYFGKISESEAAEAEWNRVKDDLLNGRKPRPKDDERVALGDLCNTFLEAKQKRKDSGELSHRMWRQYYDTCGRVVRAFGRNRSVEDLRPDDFVELRDQITKQFGHVQTGVEIQRVRTLFKYAFEQELIPAPVRMGTEFKKPSRKVLRQERAKTGKKLFSPREIRALLTECNPQMRAMVLLGLCCGLGPGDCGLLEHRHVDLDRGWLDFPRPKTGVNRRAKLWPEVVQAIRDALAVRPEPTSDDLKDRVFITRWGGCWARPDSSDTPVGTEFRKLTRRVDQLAAAAAEKAELPAPPKITRPRVAFYALRHTTETVGGESRDQPAVDLVMGHAVDDMASRYREEISDARLIAVSDRIHAWLFGQEGGAS